MASQFCPWASRSARLKRLRYVDAPASTPAEAARWVEKEAQQLAAQSAQALSSTVVVFGHVGLWRDFDVFDAYVRAPGQWLRSSEAPSLGTGDAPRRAQGTAEAWRLWLRGLFSAAWWRSIPISNAGCGRRGEMVVPRPKMKRFRWIRGIVHIDFMQKRLQDPHFPGRITFLRAF